MHETASSLASNVTAFSRVWIANISCREHCVALHDTSQAMTVWWCFSRGKKPKSQLKTEAHKHSQQAGFPALHFPLKPIGSLFELGQLTRCWYAQYLRRGVHHFENHGVRVVKCQLFFFFFSFCSP
jgi:hypothetical protein